MERYKLPIPLKVDKRVNVSLYLEPAEKRNVVVKMVRLNMPGRVFSGFAETMFHKWLMEMENSRRDEGSKHIISLYDFFYLEEGSVAVMVMEHAIHGSLYDYMQDKLAVDLSSKAMTSETYEKTELIPLFSDICMGLRYMHGLKIAHRDIKAENILITFCNSKNRIVAKIADLEMACNVSSNGTIDSVGNTLYAAPELLGVFFEEERVVHPILTDRWAVGVLLFVFTYLNQLRDVGKTDKETKAIYASMFRSWTFPLIFPPSVYTNSTQHTIQNLICEPSNRWSMEQVLAQPWIADATCHSEAQTARVYTSSSSSSSSSSPLHSFTSPSLSAHITSASSSSYSSSTVPSFQLPVSSMSASSIACSPPLAVRKRSKLKQFIRRISPRK
jgi:serine/threonine protein kinase